MILFFLQPKQTTEISEKATEFLNTILFRLEG